MASVRPFASRHPASTRDLYYWLIGRAIATTSTEFCLEVLFIPSISINTAHAFRSILVARSNPVSRHTDIQIQFEVRACLASLLFNLHLNHPMVLPNLSGQMELSLSFLACKSFVGSSNGDSIGPTGSRLAFSRSKRFSARQTDRLHLFFL